MHLKYKQEPNQFSKYLRYKSVHQKIVDKGCYDLDDALSQTMHSIGEKSAHFVMPA